MVEMNLPIPSENICVDWINVRALSIVEFLQNYSKLLANIAFEHEPVQTPIC